MGYWRGQTWRLPTRKKRQPIRYQGFTLVELIIVIIILGILAALAIPQFSRSTTDAEQSVTECNWVALQKAIQRYYHEHNSTYPSREIKSELTQYTDVDGTISVVMDKALYPYGPYLVRIPENPMSGLKENKACKIDVTDDAGPLAPDLLKEKG